MVAPDSEFQAPSISSRLPHRSFRVDLLFLSVTGFGGNLFAPLLVVRSTCLAEDAAVQLQRPPRSGFLADPVSRRRRLRLLRVARRVQNRYLALRLDLTDATNVSLAERYETVAVLTLDRRDFRAISPLTGDAAFRLLPGGL